MRRLLPVLLLALSTQAVAQPRSPVADGEFVGVARLQVARSGDCPAQFNLRILIREGRFSLRWGNDTFEGPIAADGRVEAGITVARSVSRLTGRFQGSGFLGTTDSPYCQFEVRARRA